MDGVELLFLDVLFVLQADYRMPLTLFLKQDFLPGIGASSMNGTGERRLSNVFNFEPKGWNLRSGQYHNSRSHSPNMEISHRT